MRDNTALAAACRGNHSVVGVFCIDTRWFPDQMQKTGAFQAAFWLESLRELSASLARINIPLKIVTTDDPVQAVLALAQKISAQSITMNKEYEPAQRAQDQRLMAQAVKHGIAVNMYKDGVIFEEFEVLSGSENPYTVFTAYRRAWLAKLAQSPIEVNGLPAKRAELIVAPDPVIRPETLGHRTVKLFIPAGERAGAEMLEAFTMEKMRHYRSARDFPSVAGVSQLSAHLAAGTVSIRQCAAAAVGQGAGCGNGSAETWLSELIWREFYRMILFHFPDTTHHAFQRKYMTVTWRDNPELIAAWTNARTGYPIVDAAIRQITQTGWIHNRLRMIVAMFLTRDMDSHWRIGAQQFKRWLIDYDQASNVGGWQWSAGTGTDAAPYFRVMNPILQAQRFDSDGTFVRQLIPELARVPEEFIHAPWQMPALLQRQVGCVIGQDYPAPVVDHRAARAAAIAKFRGALRDRR